MSFSPDYFAARSRFVHAAGEAGAALHSMAISATGPDRQPLTIDVATLGPARPANVVIVSSGLHGVEGFAGSAIQCAWLERATTRRVRQQIRVVLVHALNPFGFAWLRRTNEHNVDLNRNFFDDAFITSDLIEPPNRVYARLSGFLNPASVPSRFEPYTLRALAAVARHGRRALERALPIGQYEYPRGLFFGGHATEETTAIVRREMTRWTGGASLAVHLDIHTGLGRWSERQLLIADPPDTARARWVRERFGEDVRPAGDRRAYRARGTMTEDLRDRLRPCTYYGITAEFGTYSGLGVLGILRAENRAHFHARPDDPIYGWAKRRLVEAFAPHSPEWRSRVVESGVALIDRAIALDTSV